MEETVSSVITAHPEPKVGSHLVHSIKMLINKKFEDMTEFIVVTREKKLVK